MESKKRKLPARASARVEAVSKKRTSTPPREATRPPTPVPVVVEEALPKSVVAGKPLPTVEHQQPDDLSSTEYQSISESRVMAESLERSRKKWLSEGIFEKYWTKPSKKKSKDAAPAGEFKNPPKDSMSKIGQCTITIEPHVFDAIMYTVKDTTPKQPQPPPPQPLYRPIIQYGPPNGIVTQHPPPPPPPPPAPQNLYTPVQPVQPQQPQLKPQDTPIKTQAPLGSLNNTPMINSHVGSQQSPLPPITAPAAQPVVAPPLPAPPAPPAPPANPPAKSSDPVIQMLAERAATDPDLKALMRIVADGKATTDELKRFQAHIDELTRLLHARQAAAAQAAASSSHMQPPPPARQLPNPPPIATPAPPPIARQPLPPPAQARTPYHPPAPSVPQYHAPPQPQALRSKGPVSSKPDISAVVFEFVGGTGDRYLFPKYSILEYLPGGQVIASFLIVRKGSAADSPTYDPALDYYQPVTIRLWTNGSGKQLESLAKVVAPQEEVRRYMDDIMDNMTRAEYVLLAMRLPRDAAHAPPSKEEVEEKSEVPNDAVLWNTSVYEVAAATKTKPPPRLLTEEEKYQNFIKTVS